MLMTTMSNGHRPPHSSTSHGTFSRLMTYTSASTAIARVRSAALPRTRLIRRCDRWSHFAASRAQALSLGAKD